MLVFLHSDQLQLRKYKSIKEENIQSVKQVLIKIKKITEFKVENIQSVKQVLIKIKKISEFKVQKRYVVLRFTEVSLW